MEEVQLRCALAIGAPHEQAKGSGHIDGLRLLEEVEREVAAREREVRKPPPGARRLIAEEKARQNDLTVQRRWQKPPPVLV